MDEDDRLKPILTNISKQYLGKDYNQATPMGDISADDVDKVFLAAWLRRIVIIVEHEYIACSIALSSVYETYTREVARGATFEAFWPPSVWIVFESNWSVPGRGHDILAKSVFQNVG
jgi:hypothetical protein